MKLMRNNFKINNKVGFMSNKEPKVIGIGGILFKSKSPDKIKKWYEENLG